MNLKAPEKVKRVNEKNEADFESREVGKRVKVIKYSNLITVVFGQSQK